MLSSFKLELLLLKVGSNLKILLAKWRRLKAMDLTFNLAPSYRDLKDPTSRQNFEDMVEQKRVIDLRACHNNYHLTPSV